MWSNLVEGDAVGWNKRKVNAALNSNVHTVKNMPSHVHYEVTYISN